MVSLANPLVSSLPWGKLNQPFLLTGLFCTMLRPGPFCSMVDRQASGDGHVVAFC